VKSCSHAQKYRLDLWSTEHQILWPSTLTLWHHNLMSVTRSITFKPAFSEMYPIQYNQEGQDPNPITQSNYFIWLQILVTSHQVPNAIMPRPLANLSTHHSLEKLQSLCTSSRATVQIPLQQHAFIKAKYRSYKCHHRMRRKFLNVPVTHRKQFTNMKKIFWTTGSILDNKRTFRQTMCKKTFSLTYTENGHVCNNNTKYNK